MGSVRDYLEKAPWWVWSLIYGVYFWVIMVVTNRFFISHDWTASIVGGSAGATVTGLTIGPLTARRLRRVLAATGQLSSDERRAAGKAVARGPVPADPEIRRAAAWMANDQLAGWHRVRLPVFIVCGLFVALAIFVAVTSSVWSLAAAGLPFAVVAICFWEVRRLRRRAVLLED